MISKEHISYTTITMEQFLNKYGDEDVVKYLKGKYSIKEVREIYQLGVKQKREIIKYILKNQRGNKVISYRVSGIDYATQIKGYCSKDTIKVNYKIKLAMMDNYYLQIIELKDYSKEKMQKALDEVWFAEHAIQVVARRLSNSDYSYSKDFRPKIQGINTNNSWDYMLVNLAELDVDYMFEDKHYRNIIINDWLCELKNFRNKDIPLNRNLVKLYKERKIAQNTFLDSLMEVKPIKKLGS